MQYTAVPIHRNERVSVSRSQYIEAPPRWKLLLPNLNSSMGTIPACALMLVASAGMMMSEVSQFMLLGSILAGAALGSVFKVTKTLITKSEDEAPRQIILYRFFCHAAGGTVLGLCTCLIALFWFKMEIPLILLGVTAGGLSGWLSESVAKRFEPKILDALERAGRIPPRGPSDREVLELGAKRSTDTVRLAPTTKIEL